MRILVISDFNLTTEERFTKPEDFIDERVGLRITWNSIGYRLYPLSEFIEMIDTVQPELVFIGGDLFNMVDKDRETQREAVISFLDYLNENKIQCFFVIGNHDLIHYEALSSKAEKCEYIKMLSDEIVTWKGFKILGLSHAFTHSLKNCRNIKEIYPDKIDFVISHAEFSKRIFLLELEAEFIFSGHYGNSISILDNRFLITTDSAPAFYFVLDYNENEYNLEFCGDDSERRATFDGTKIEKTFERKPPRISKLTKQNLSIRWFKDELYLKENKFSKQLIKLYESKNEFFMSDLSSQEIIVNELLKQDVPKTWIVEYLKWKFYKCEKCDKRFRDKSGLDRHLTTHKREV